jgi:hypothetical protein
MQHSSEVLMKKLFLFMLVGSVAVGALTSRNLLTKADLTDSSLVSQAGNAAFRDGMHLGRFDAESGRTRHLSVGRWSSDSNRAWFVAGYQAGYQANTLKANAE